MFKFVSNIIHKLCDLLGEGEEIVKRSHRITGGRGEGQDGPKKDHMIFERSLTFLSNVIQNVCNLLGVAGVIKRSHCITRGRDGRSRRAKNRM